MGFIVFVVSMGLAFVLPGAVVATVLRSPTRGAASFIISSVLLFELLYLMQVFGFTLSYWNVVAVLVVFSAVGVIRIASSHQLPKRSPLAAASDEPVIRSETYSWRRLAVGLPTRPVEVLLAIPVLFSTIILAARAWLQPLSGYDTSFRWSWLAEHILSVGNFDYYPPITASDFAHYFYVDAIPPMCQFSYFWLYASLGKVDFQWTAVLVVVQYLLIVFFCFRISEKLGGRTAAFFAIATLSTSVIFFWSLVMGQETGLTALSVSATVYFILSATGKNQKCTMVVAAFATTLGILSREYGWAFLICGSATALFTGIKRKHIILYAVIACTLSAPWYLRTWILTGNPFYSNPVGSLFPVNAVHCMLLRHYESIFSLTADPLQKLDFLSFLVRSKALLVMPAGVLGLWYLRRHYWVHVSVLICGLTWLITVSHTAGGLFYSTRVLSTVFVLLSVSSGVFLSRMYSRGPLVRSAIFIVVGLISTTALLQEVIVPGHLETVDSATWYRRGFSPANVDSWVVPFFEEVPNGSRCLSDWAAVWVEMRPRGVEVVPVWSPDAAIVFDKDKTPEEIARRLRQENIQWLLISRMVNLNLLVAESPLYRFLLTTRPEKISESGSQALYFLGNVDKPEQPTSRLIEHIRARSDTSDTVDH